LNDDFEIGDTCNAKKDGLEQGKKPTGQPSHLLTFCPLLSALIASQLSSPLSFIIFPLTLAHPR